jgi:hypothetical protein
MGQIDEKLDALEDDVVGLAALNVRNEANSAGIVLISGIIEPLSGR